MKYIDKHSTNRISIIDIMRGLAVVLMVIYHGMYDMEVILGIDINLDRYYLFQQFIGFLFIFTSGVSFNLSRNNIKSGLKILAVAYCLTIVTYFYDPSFIIRFGVLHMLGWSTIVYGFIDKRVDSISLGIFLFLLFGVFWTVRISTIDILVSLTDLNLYPIGLPAPSFVSSDYYPLVPWMFLYGSGIYIGRYLLNRVEDKYLYMEWFPVLSWIGRHSLIIYIIHQPVVLGILYILFSQV